MEDPYGELFQTVLTQTRKIASISELERSGVYEPLKAKIYELLRAGETDATKIATEALSFVRQNVQINQSASRVRRSG
jgi:hypothetical protein